MKLYKNIILLFAISLQPKTLLQSMHEITNEPEPEYVFYKNNEIFIDAKGYPSLKAGFTICGQHDLQSFFDKKSEEFEMNNQQKSYDDDIERSEHINAHLNYVTEQAETTIINTFLHDQLYAKKFCKTLIYIIENNLDINSTYSFFRPNSPSATDYEVFDYCKECVLMTTVVQKYVKDFNNTGDSLCANGSLIRRAIRYNHAQAIQFFIAKKLINKKAPLEYADQTIQETPANLIDEMVRVCLDHSADKVIPLLLPFVADIDSTNYPCNVSLLHIAASWQDYQLTKSIIDAGANTNQKRNTENSYTVLYEDTPILTAIVYENENSQAIVSLLLESRADINLQNSYGFGPLHKATHKNKTDVLSLLLTKKPNLNLQDNNGDTPLHHAVRHKNKKAISLLIRAGADLTVENNKNQTPWQAAQNEEIRDLLKPADEQKCIIS